MNLQCPFCNIDRHRVVLENDLALVIRDSYPVSPGHTLTLPKRHLASLWQTTAEEQLALWQLLPQAKVQLDEEYQPAGYNIGINDGVQAGQTILHLHIHLIPRYQGDCQDPRGGLRWILPEKAVYWG